MRKFLIWLLCAAKIFSVSASGMAEVWRESFADMRTIATLSGNGNDYIVGGTTTETGDILVYGWTSSTAWDDHPHVKQYASCRDALAIMLSKDGSVRWVFTDGDANIERMDSIVGAAAIGDKIVLCHRHMMDYTWEEVYGITVLDTNGRKILQYDFDAHMVVKDTASSSVSIIVTGYYTQEESWIPYIYSIGAAGERIFEYKGEPLSWANETGIENSFDEVAANEQGTIVGILNQEKNTSEIVALDSSGNLIKKTEIPFLTNHHVCVLNSFCCISRYSGNNYTILCAKTASLCFAVSALPLSKRERVIALFSNDDAFFYISEKDEARYALYSYDPLQNTIRTVFSDIPCAKMECVGGKLLPGNKQLILYGNTKVYSANDTANIIVISGT